MTCMALPSFIRLRLSSPTQVAPLDFLPQVPTPQPRYHSRRLRPRETRPLVSQHEGLNGSSVFPWLKTIKLIRWLDHFVAQCDADMVPEVAAVQLAPHFLDQPTGDEYGQGRAGRSRNPLAPSEGLTTWPGAVNYLMSLYIDCHVLAEEARRLSTIGQEPTKTGLAYYERLASAIRNIPDTYEPAELMSYFIERLKDIFRPKAQVESPRFDSNSHGLHFVVQELTKIAEVWTNLMRGSSTPVAAGPSLRNRRDHRSANPYGSGRSRNVPLYSHQ